LTAMPAFRRRDGSNKLTAYLHISSGMHRTGWSLGSSSHRETPISRVHDGLLATRSGGNPPLGPFPMVVRYPLQRKWSAGKPVSRFGGNADVSSSRDSTPGDQE
jgi:hypothetical protein